MNFDAFRGFFLALLADPPAWCISAFSASLWLFRVLWGPLGSFGVLSGSFWLSGSLRLSLVRVHLHVCLLLLSLSPQSINIVGSNVDDTNGS